MRPRVARVVDKERLQRGELLLHSLIFLDASIDDDLAVGVRDRVEERRGAFGIRASNKVLDALTPERRGEMPFAQSFHQLTANGGVVAVRCGPRAFRSHTATLASRWPRYANNVPPVLRSASWLAVMGRTGRAHAVSNTTNNRQDLDILPVLAFGIPSAAQRRSLYEIRLCQLVRLAELWLSRCQQGDANDAK
jgi:hypothetical protein